MSYNKDYYQKTGNEYRHYFRHQLSALLRALYIKFLFNPKTVLDLGCGMANLVETLRRLGVKAYGLDISEYALSQIPEGLKQFCHQEDVLKMSYQDKKFDVVTTVNFLEHVQPADIDRFIAKSARVAKRGIYHEITVLEDKRTIDKDPTHCSKYARNWWFKKFSKLKGWRVKKGPSIPVFKNGVFLLRRENGNSC